MSTSTSRRSRTSRNEVVIRRCSSAGGSLASATRRSRSHSSASASVARKASSVSLGKASMNPMVSASRILGLASMRPTVVSSVEKRRSSTRTSLPDRARKRLDFPALVYPARPTVLAPPRVRCRRRSAWALACRASRRRNPSTSVPARRAPHRHPLRRRHRSQRAPPSSPD